MEDAINSASYGDGEDRSAERLPTSEFLNKYIINNGERERERRRKKSEDSKTKSETRIVG